VEVVLLVRGGGSRDDLNPFDDERVVRAIRSVPVPLITGLGHQIDLTLSDLAADVHAPTPSAAAEMAFPDRMELLRRLEAMEKSASFCLGKRIERLESELARLKENLVSACLRGHLEAGERSAEDALFRLNYAVEARLSEAEGRLAESAASLNALSPLKAFDRGWVTCLDADGHVVTQASDLKVGDELKVQFSDGDAAAEVQEITLLPHWLREVKTCSPSLSSGEEEP
ncbi:MAG: exodeoxyribonuclease VII large subunit, partial [Synergistota bacterium]|nr:exodeoxyribonuclease VII large subunit [Synergistota bacterium]